MWFIVFQRIGLEFLLHIVFFPVWWYTRGAVHAAGISRGFFMDGNNMLAPSIWLRNLFVPMYGQADWEGRIVSVFIRLINIIVRSALLAVWSLIAAAFFMLWLAAPAIILFMLFWRQ